MIPVILAILMGSTGLNEPAYMRAGDLDLSEAGYNLILKHEVGGGYSYYTKYLQRPTYPGGASGVTIGVGYDLGYNTRTQIYNDWHGKVSSNTVSRLQNCSGKKSGAARYYLSSVRNIIIPWDAALAVYKERTMPRFASITIKSYPGVQKANPSIQSAMLSWTFNRGGGISSSSRDREKRALRTHIRNQEWWEMPKEFRSSKRLWYGKGLNGLLRRRDDEADLIEGSL